MSSRTKGRAGLLMLAGLLTAGLVAVYLAPPGQRVERLEAPVPPETTEVAAPARPAVSVPTDLESLPALEASDPVVRTALEKVFGTALIARFLVPEDVVGRFVATVDNLPRERVAVKLRPIESIDGRFLARRNNAGNGAITLSDLNYQRYEPLIDALRTTSAERLVTMYERFYPLLQKAYENLGYPGQSFHNRFLAVIEHLLETPEVVEPIELVQPNVFYEFANPELEALSAGQKFLVRMGPRNAALIKDRLREVHGRLVEAGSKGALAAYETQPR